MPLTKKSKMKRQGVALQRQSRRRDLFEGLKPSKDFGHADAASSVAKLTRSIGSTNVLAGRGEGRRKRAEANADLRPPTSVANPVRKRADAVGSDNRQPDKQGKQAKSRLGNKKDTKIDFATGRVLFPVEVGGKIQYLPVASEANEHERRNGNFVSDASIQIDAVNTLDANAQMMQDVYNQRQLFATTDENGDQEFLPSESDATALELANGKYIPDEQLTAPSIALGLLDIAANKQKSQLVYDFTHQRNLFAVRTEDGRDINVPMKSKATASELKWGLYIDDALVSKKVDLSPAKAMTNDPARLDLANQRLVYAAKDENGKIIYLPKQSEATALERARGLFIPDDVVIEHEFNRSHTALRHRDEQAQSLLRRAQRVDKLAGGVTASNINAAQQPITRANDGTELWDGFSLPNTNVTAQKQTLSKLRPRYDLTENRMLYPTETAKGKISYLPLLKDATDVERLRQNYAAFVPQQSLSEFISNANLTPRTFDTKDGQVQAFSQADINNAFMQASNLVLRQAALVSEGAKLTPELQQQWKE